MEISLSAEMARYLEEKVQSGQYPSPTDVVHGALELMREEERLAAEQLAELKRMVQHGVDQLDRGEGAPWDVEETKARVLREFSPARKAD